MELSYGQKKRIREIHIVLSILRKRNAYGKFMHNCSKSHHKSIEKYRKLLKEQYPSNFIIDGFSWLSSSEGADYWFSIHKEVQFALEFAAAEERRKNNGKK